MNIELYSQIPTYPVFQFFGNMVQGSDVVDPGVRINELPDDFNPQTDIVEAINISYLKHKIYTRATPSGPLIYFADCIRYHDVAYPRLPKFPNDFVQFGDYPNGAYAGYRIIDAALDYFTESDWRTDKVRSIDDVAFNTIGQRVGGDTSFLYNPVTNQSEQAHNNYVNGNFLAIESWVSGSRQYRIATIPTVVKDNNRPTYIDLLSGYKRDNRVIPNKPVINSPTSRTITISYYRENKLESIPNLRSIDWLSYRCQLLKDIDYTLPIVECVLGTLVTDAVTKTAISSISTSANQYPYSYLFTDSLQLIFNSWNALYSQQPLSSTNILRISGANNNHWNNRSTPTSDLNVSSNHPLFYVNYQRSFDWHIKQQATESYGDLVMDSPRTIEIHAALNAGKWGVNPDDNTKPRKDDLGWRIQRTNEILGIRIGTNGKFDPEKEKKIVRQVIPSDTPVDDEKIGVNNFGSGGRIVKRINNRFDKDNIASDQCVIVHDLMQLIEEYHEQHNLAIGLQESSAIEIKNPNSKNGNDRARFDNQLGLLLEMFNLLSSANEMTRANLISSLVTQSQTSELIAGLGLPSITKTIPIKIDNKVKQLPYKGIAAHRSISQEVATCTANVGIVLGQLL